MLRLKEQNDKEDEKVASLKLHTLHRRKWRIWEKTEKVSSVNFEGKKSKKSSKRKLDDKVSKRSFSSALKQFPHEETSIFPRSGIFLHFPCSLAASSNEEKTHETT